MASVDKLSVSSNVPSRSYTMAFILFVIVPCLTLPLVLAFPPGGITFLYMRTLSNPCKGYVCVCSRLLASGAEQEKTPGGQKSVTHRVFTNVAAHVYVFRTSHLVEWDEQWICAGVRRSVPAYRTSLALCLAAAAVCSLPTGL